jgi:HSP20 family protein
MNPISRYEPFNRSFDDFFKGMFLRPVRLDVDAMPELQLKLDITESGDTYQVSAEMPGVKKEDIKVSVEGNLVRISAETKKETEEKQGDQVLRSERYYGRLERAFTLDGEVDDSKVDAKYADGVLKLKLPKKATGASRRITVG